MESVEDLENKIIELEEQIELERSKNDELDKTLKKLNKQKNQLLGELDGGNNENQPPKSTQSVPTTSNSDKAITTSAPSETKTNTSAEKTTHVRLSKEVEFNVPGYKPLSQAEVDDLMDKFGPNVISSQKRRGWWVVLWHSLIHPFNGVLAILAIVSGATQDFITMTLMLLMILLSSGLRFVQELKNEYAANALKQLVQTMATVVRRYEPPDDRDPTPEDVAKIKKGISIEKEVPLTDIVPGDLVRLSVGDLIPGDVKLIESKDLYISQAALTGESMPVEKVVVTEEKPLKPNETKFDIQDRCYMGSSVISGTGVAIVLETGKPTPHYILVFKSFLPKKKGSRTIFGELAKELAKLQTVSAFQKGIRKISWMFVIV